MVSNKFLIGGIPMAFPSFLLTKMIIDGINPKRKQRTKQVALKAVDFIKVVYDTGALRVNIISFKTITLKNPIPLPYIQQSLD